MMMIITGRHTSNRQLLRRRNAWTKRWKRWSAVVLSSALASLPLAAADLVVSDRAVTRTIEADLKEYDGVAAHLIDVTTRNGIVSLQGTVDHLLARDQAVALAKSIKGVRGVVDQMTIQPVDRTDAQVRIDVLAALESDPATEAWQIDAQVAEGKVTLSGQVESWQERQLAEQVTKGVVGVRDVRNDILYIPTRNRPDQDLAADIRQALKMDARVDHTMIAVKVADAAVTLSGSVPSSSEKTLAEELCWVNGVKSVSAKALEVAYDEVRNGGLRPRPPKLSDTEIERAVAAALRIDPRVDDGKIELMASSGVVTLMGTVDSMIGRHAAERDARNTVGVQSVVNYLKVRPLAQVSDLTLRKRVAEALRRNPYLARHDILFAVRNGRVNLSGELDSNFEVAQVNRTLSRVKGVVDINNQLTATGAELKPYSLDYAWHDYIPDGYYPFFNIPTSLDDKIRQDVEKQLFWSPFIDSDQIEVSVNDGTVKLTGFVEDYVERRIATENAWEGGAQGVLNHLEVR